MGSITPASTPAEPLWRETPCLLSAALSERAGCSVYLKLENLQPSRSFKSRGIGHLMQQALLRAEKTKGSSGDVHFFCSSGGNAGIACVTAAIQLNRPATIVLPTTSSPLMLSKLQQLTAAARAPSAVLQHGAVWSDADAYLRSELLTKRPGGVYVPPFDHEDVWTGASTMMDELRRQLPGGFDGVVCSAGGGGLFAGVMQGLQAQPAPPDRTPAVMVVETLGAESLAASLAAGSLVALPAITSIATSLGATRVAQRAFELAQQDNVHSAVVTDADAAMATVEFADTDGALVEVACGASLAVLYNGQLRQVLGAGLSAEEWRQKKIVVILCGGNNVTLELLKAYREKYAAAAMWTK